MLTIERVMELLGVVRDVEMSLPALSCQRMTLVPITMPEMNELCRAWLALETRVKCEDAEKMAALDRRRPLGDRWSRQDLEAPRLSTAIVDQGYVERAKERAQSEDDPERQP